MTTSDPRAKTQNEASPYCALLVAVLRISCLCIVTVAPSLQAEAVPDVPAGQDVTNRTAAAEAKINTAAPVGKRKASYPLSTTATNRDSEPRLRPGLVLDVIVVVSGQREISETGRLVSNDGDINLPLVGTVRVQGMTLKELAEHLRVAYGTYLRKPEVDVGFNLTSLSPASPSMSPWGLVTVLGQVKNPGSVSIPQTQDLTLRRAIQSAGGLDELANDSSIKISRRNPDGTTKRISVNLHKLGARGELKQDVKLEPGDVVYVPEEFF